MGKEANRSLVGEYLEVTRRYAKTDIWKEYTIRAKDKALIWKDRWGVEHIAGDPEEAEKQMITLLTIAEESKGTDDGNK